MKRIGILFIAYAAICMGACEQVSDLEEKLENTASIVLAEGQETNIDIAPKGETVSINFKSTLEWKTEYETNTSDDDWFQMIPKSGKGGDSICKIKVGKNDSGKKRSVSIYIISEDVKEEFKLTQKSLDINNDDDDEEEEENGGGEGNENGNEGENGDGDENENGDGNGEGENEEEVIPDPEWPDDSQDPNATTVAEILAIGVGKTLPQNSYISVHVISDQELGNLTSLKNAYVQDQTGGLMIRFVANHSYNRGDLLKVNVSGKSLEDYYGTIQLNNVPLEDVEVVSTGNEVPYKTVSITDFLANKYSGQYVALDNIQVADSDLGKTFVSGGSHTSINMEDDKGNSFVVFSSKFATFGAETVPGGSGKLKGIASINNGKIQIIFSKSDDWAGLTGPRHGESTGGNEDNDDDISAGANTNGYLVNYEVPHADVRLAAGAAYSSRVSETNGGSAYAYIYETNTSNQRIVTHTFNNNGIHRNYTFLYDYEKRCPIWLAYHLNNGFCSTNGDRSERWAYDPAIPEASQPNLSSSYSSGGNPYNRGHMLASHCRTGITNANTQTFYYTNMTPQLSASFNTGAGVWNKLEGAEEGFTPSGRDTLYVVTGCLFDANVKTMTCAKDGMKCAVPDDFYKCFMLCSFDSSGKMTGAEGIGYLMPHETPVGTGYSGFAKSIDEIEALAGFDFFCNVPEKFQNSAEANKTALF